MPYNHSSLKDNTWKKWFQSIHPGQDHNSVVNTNEWTHPVLVMNEENVDQPSIPPYELYLDDLSAC